MIAASTICYTHGKLLGLDRAAAVLDQQLHGRPVRGAPPVPAIECIRSVAQLSPLDPLSVNIDVGGASLGKARCRALDWAIKSGCDIWISVDDDCTASPGTLASLLTELSVDTARCISVPMIQRAPNAFEKPQVNIFPLGATPTGKLMPIEWSGFGLVGMNRPALEVIRELAKQLNFVDDDGETRNAMFHEIRERLPGSTDSFWFSEDISFWKRLPATIERWALVDGESEHAGVVLELAHALAGG